MSEGDIDNVVLFNLQHPHSILGPKVRDGGTEVYSYLPLAVSASVIAGGKEYRMEELRDRLFMARVPGKLKGPDYVISLTAEDGSVRTRHDPFAFPVTMSDDDLYLFKRGDLHYSYRTMGAHIAELEGMKGTVFRVWAPNAASVSVIGDFNGWKIGCTPMDNVQESGIWEIFVPDVGNGGLYKFAIKSSTDGNVMMKTDPYAFRTELRPSNASVISVADYEWSDSEWVRKREPDYDKSPISVYEVHLGSWRRRNGVFMNYREIAPLLLDHIRNLGFNYIELLPVMEHPLDASWGYQVTNYYAPTSRFGTPSDFKFFMDFMHRNGIGVILDWVPAHFPADDFGLALYDGSHLYEHEDPKKGRHPDWGTLIFNYARNEVYNFLMSNAIYWIDEFHADGLRIDAVSSMLYLDYSRKNGEWSPNQYGGNENLEAVSFIRSLNDLVHDSFPGVLMIAEESTAWPGVTRNTKAGGLGFDLKWNMGWMHDSLHYFSLDPVYRKYNQNELTFSMWYAFNERFILPVSHDEVVHGKGSLIGKMPGDTWRKLANARLFFTYMFTFPGKKLLFMGAEMGQEREWNFDGELDWQLYEKGSNAGLSNLLRDLNALYVQNACLRDGDFDGSLFEWIDFSDSDNSVISFVRHSSDRKAFILSVFNFTPVPRHGYRIGVPEDGEYTEVLNTDAEDYSGSGQGNLGKVVSEPVDSHGRKWSVSLTLPPLGALIFFKEHSDD